MLVRGYEERLKTEFWARYGTERLEFWLDENVLTRIALRRKDS